MKIGHYEHDIWARGGVANYIRRVAASQRELGHEVVFFSKRGAERSNGEFAAQLVSTNAELYAVAEQLGVDILHTHRSLELSPPRFLPVIRTVHGHEPYCPSGSRFLSKRGLPCDRAYNPARCLVAHGWDRCGSIRPQNLWRRFQETRREQQTLQQVTMVAVSDFIGEQLVRAGYPTENINVLHLFAPDISAPPVDLPGDGRPRFVVAGRVAEAKGIKWLLQALREVQLEVQLDVVGDGHLLSEMKALAQELGLEERVEFHGWVSPDTVLKLIQAARALVFPSIWHEPGGTVAFEAMSQGRAVIMSRVGGMPEVVRDGKTGLLVEPSHVEQLANAIDRLASDHQLATNLGQAGYEQVCQRFTRSQHLKQLMHLYEQTIQQKRHDLSWQPMKRVVIG